MFHAVTELALANSFLKSFICYQVGQSSSGYEMFVQQFKRIHSLALLEALQNPFVQSLRAKGSQRWLHFSAAKARQVNAIGHGGLQVSRLSFREIVALSGAHGLGACHTDRSGFWGPWTRAPTTVSNEYYRELLENTWTIKTTHKGQPWKGPLQFEDPTGDLMMLPSDLDDSLFQKDFAKVVGKLFALGCQDSKRFGFF
eukprot:s1198_g24.t1